MAGRVDLLADINNSLRPRQHDRIIEGFAIERYPWPCRPLKHLLETRWLHAKRAVLQTRDKSSGLSGLRNFLVVYTAVCR